MNWTVVHMLMVLCFHFNSTCLADINSGCPSWGCLPSGSFSLSSGIPKTTANVRWRVGVEEVPSNSKSSLNQSARGCVSCQRAIVCTTQSGYVSIDPTNGKRLWNYTTMSSPYLPIMDINGDIIGMDVKAMYYVGADGRPETPIKLSGLMPSYSLMAANDSILLLTGSTNRTAQLVTYYTDGIIDASMSLDGTVEQVNGTFLPCSHPIIAGFRAFIITCFSPDEVNSKDAMKVSGALRLYAIDLLNRISPRMRVAWYFDFAMESSSYHSAHHFTKKWSVTGRSQLDTLLTYFEGIVYVSVPDGVPERVAQPWPATMWAIRDARDRGTLVFQTSCFYGPVAVYNTQEYFSTKDNKNTHHHDDKRHVIWTMNHSPPKLLGLDSMNGSHIPVKGLDVIFESLGGWITSRLTITRSKDSPDNDQLLFGITNSSGQAKLVVVEVDQTHHAKLVFSRTVSNSEQRDGTTTHIEGQIVNFAFHTSGEHKDTWTLGLSAVLTEWKHDSIFRYIVGVF